MEEKVLALQAVESDWETNASGCAVHTDDGLLHLHL